MPSKSRRAASRQAQLKRKRQRGKSRSQEFDPGPTEPRQPASTLEAEEDADVAAVATVSPTAQQAVRQAPRSRRQSLGETPLTYPYLSSELKQIGAISALIVVTLVVLTFVLGS